MNNFFFFFTNPSSLSRFQKHFEEHQVLVNYALKHGRIRGKNKTAPVL